MALVGKPIGKIQLAQTSLANSEAIVTNVTLKDTCLTYLIAYNSHSSAVVMTLSCVLNNNGSLGTAAATDVFFSESLDAGETMFLTGDELRIWLTGTNDSVQGYASVASKINVFAFGIVITNQE